MERKGEIAQRVPFLCSFWQEYIPETAQKWDMLGDSTFSLPLAPSPKFALRLIISQKK